MSKSLIPSFLMSDVSESLRSLTKNEQCEQIAQVAHQKWAMWANRSGRSPKMCEWANRSFFRANRSFAHFFAKHERFAQKNDEQIPSPEFFCLLDFWLFFSSHRFRLLVSSHRISVNINTKGLCKCVYAWIYSILLMFTSPFLAWIHIL